LDPLTGLRAPEPIGEGHDLSQFDCGVPVLDDWLRQRALAQRKPVLADLCPVSRARGWRGSTCISAGAVERARVPGKLRRNAPDSVPVAVIGRLAVDRAYAGRGLGADLLADALRRIAGAAGVIGIAAVLVQAKDEAAKAWYLRQAEFMAFRRTGECCGCRWRRWWEVREITHPTAC
jgi:GNAT superfamily N-acetyltransferase